MAINNQQIQDPTKEGVKGLKGLGGLKRLQDRGINLDTSIFDLSNNYKNTMNLINQNIPHSQDIGFVGINESQYDKDITSVTELENLNETRAELQPWYSKIANGIAKGAILAGTTFLDGTLGLVFGATQATAEKRFSALWDNEFSKATQAINQQSEQWLPNYYSERELNNPWYENIFTSNFIGDKFLKNLGFAVGAFYSGNVFSSLLKLSKIPQVIGILTNSVKAPQMVISGLGATISALNEGRIEALNHATEVYNNEKSLLDEAFSNRLKNLEILKGSKEYGLLLAQENENYEESLAKLNENRLKIGNADVLFNTLLLIAPNILQFGKLYGGGFNNSRRLSSIINKDGLYTTNKSIGKGITRAALNPLSEGFEEISQKAITKVTEDYYLTDFSNFYRSKIDPNAEQETLSLIKSFAKGMNDTLNEGSSWEEFFIGSLTGALGMPTFRGVRSKEGKLQSPISIKEGFAGSLKGYINTMKEESDLANKINSRLQSPEILNYYQGLIRHNKYQKDMDIAVENDSEFDFKNAEHAQLISDINMFDNAGKLDDLIAIIESSVDTSDENLKSIVENTTTITEDINGKEVKAGPFIDKNGKPLYITEDGKKEMINKLTKDKNEFLDKIKEYNKIKNNIDTNTNGRLSDEQLEELVWLNSQINNWNSRASKLSEEVKPIIGTIIGRMSQLSNVLNNIKNKEGSSNKGITEEYLKAEEGELSLNKNIESLEYLRGLDNEVFSHFITKMPNIVDDIKNILKNPIHKIDPLEIKNISKKLDDITKLVNGASKFQEKLREYTENPNKITENIEETKSTVEKESKDNNIKELKSKLNEAQSVHEIRKILDETEDEDIKDKVLKDLYDYNKYVKDYKEIKLYNDEVIKAINSEGITPETKERVLKLFEDQVKNSSNLNEISNTDSLSLNNDELIYDDSLDEETNFSNYQEAKYILSKIMDKINSDNNFRSKFSKTHVSLNNEKQENINKDKESFKPEEPKVVIELPVGNINNTDIIYENNQTNNNTTESQSLDVKYGNNRPYYRPTIPEIHIEASKEGDFRPFNEVVSEKNPNLDFNEIYNYLLNSGAFTYVNEGNLKVGDEIGFMIDPSFNEHTIFLIDKKNNQIVGSLDESEYSVNKFIGLKELSNRIRNEYSKRNSEESVNKKNLNSDESQPIENKFIATPTTKVSQIMIGKIPYTNQENNLSKVNTNGKPFIFGIIKNGVLSTNHKINDSDIIKPADMTNKEGRMYLLVPNAAGKYTPIAVRVKHFNKEEFNPEDITVKETSIYKNIQEAVTLLANSLSEEDLKEAVKSLKNVLYNGDLHIDWVSSDKGDGIRFTKIKRDSNGKEIYQEKNGKRYRVEDSKIIFLTNPAQDILLATITGDDKVELHEDNTPKLDSKNMEDIKNEIIDTLLSFNLPIQVNLGMLNTSHYNDLLVNSGVLTSNISEIKTVGSWFTMDYFNSEGELQSASKLNSKIPEPKTEFKSQSSSNLDDRIEVSLDGVDYKVDLNNKKIYDNNNQEVFIENKELLLDIAIANSIYGNKINGYNLIDNKVILPNGKILDRITNTYLSEEEASNFLNRFKNRKKSVKKAEDILSEIESNQERVDKTKTDGDYYYVLEEDGQYYQYDRVHKVIGNNWKTTFNSTTSLEGGAAVDKVIREFFISNDIPIKPDNMSEEAFNKLIESLNKVKQTINNNGERFLTNNIVLFHKYADGRRVAGEVDILAVDAEGRFKIYDVKTSKYSFYEFTNSKGEIINYFENKSNSQLRSNKEYYTLQLSAYKNLFESQYKTPILSLGILPFVLKYNQSIISDITQETGIPILYNPFIERLLVNLSNEKIDKSLPIFNSLLGTQDYKEELSDENKMTNSQIGYYIREGEIYKGYLSPIGEIEGINIHIAKIPIYTKGFGGLDTESHIAMIDYYAVFPNGNSIRLIQDPLSLSDDEAKNTIKEILSKNPQRVINISKEETLLSNKQKNSSEEDIQSTGAFKLMQAENSLKEEYEDDEDDLILGNEVSQNDNVIINLFKTDDFFDDTSPFNELQSVDNTLIKGEVYTLNKVKELFYKYNEDPQQKVLANRVFEIASQLGLKVSFLHENLGFNIGGIQDGDTIKYSRWVTFEKNKDKLSHILLHEIIHGVTTYVIDAYNDGELKNNNLIKAVEILQDSFNIIKDTGTLNKEYGLTNIKEMIAELSNPDFRQKLDKINVWDKIKQAIKKIFFFESPNKVTANKMLDEALNKMLDNFDYDLFEKYSRTQNINENDWNFYKTNSTSNSFESLNNEAREALLNKGWTSELFNSISQEERNKALECVTL